MFRSMRLLFVVLLLSACYQDDPFRPPPTATAYDSVPAIYATWWQNMETCSGKTGALSRIRWFSVPKGQLIWHDDTVAGVWMRPHNIYVEEHRVEWGQYTVSHEMLHDLLQVAGHPAVFDTCHVR